MLFRSRDVVKELPAAENAANWISRNFMPMAGADDNAVRIIESTLGRKGILQEEGLKITQDLQNLERGLNMKDQVTVGQKQMSLRDLINTSLENGVNSPEFAELRNINPDYANILENRFFPLRDEAFSYALSVNIPPELRGLIGQNPNYVRNVPEVFAVTKRTKSFEDFLAANPTMLADLKADVLKHPKLYNKDLKVFGPRNRLQVSPAELDEAIYKFAEEKYQPTRLFRQEAAVFDPRVKVPEPLKKIMGYNAVPSLRASETIGGIIKIGRAHV